MLDKQRLYNCDLQENFDYASEYGQKLLHSFHHSFESVNNIVRSKDGNFPEFWLEVFRKWLLGKMRPNFPSRFYRCLNLMNVISIYRNFKQI